jgi:hypothetical protein
VDPKRKTGASAQPRRRKNLKTQKKIRTQTRANSDHRVFYKLDITIALQIFFLKQQKSKSAKKRNPPCPRAFFDPKNCPKKLAENAAH